MEWPGFVRPCQRQTAAAWREGETSNPWPISAAMGFRMLPLSFWVELNDGGGGVGGCFRSLVVDQHRVQPWASTTGCTRSAQLHATGTARSLALLLHAEGGRGHTGCCTDGFLLEHLPSTDITYRRSWLCQAWRRTVLASALWDGAKESSPCLVWPRGENRFRHFTWARSLTRRSSVFAAFPDLALSGSLSLLAGSLRHTGLGVSGATLGRLGLGLGPAERKSPCVGD